MRFRHKAPVFEGILPGSQRLAEIMWRSRSWSAEQQISQRRVVDAE